MLSQKEITEILRAALRETLADDPARAEAYDEESPLGGAQGLLDSYSMMYFLVEVDALLSEKTGRDVILVNDDTLARQEKPMRSLGAFARYIEEFLGT